MSNTRRVFIGAVTNNALISDIGTHPIDTSPLMPRSSTLPIAATWLTMNPNLGASARTLQDWLRLEEEAGLSLSIVLQHDGDLKRWLHHARVPHIQSSMPWPDRRRVVRSYLHALKLKRWMKHTHAQVIHCYEHDLYPFAVALRRITSLPLVCHVHFSVTREFASWAFGARKQPDALIWTSRQQRADCADAIAGLVPNDRQHVIPLGIDATHFGSLVDQGVAFRQRLGFGPKTVLVGMACALRARKKIDDFLEMMRRLHQHDANVVGLLAGDEVRGDEAYARDVIPRIRACAATGAIRWLGHLEPVEPFIQAVDIVVSTSEYETFGMSVLEAMACGKPVAGYRGGAVGEILAGTGLLVDTGDLPSLVSVVQTLATDRDLRGTLGRAAKLRVATDFNPHHSLLQLRQVYESILAPA